MIFLTKNDNARDYYKDDYLEARFHLIKIWELDAAKYLEAGLEVQPFIPLMKGGLTHVLDAITEALLQALHPFEIAGYGCPAPPN